MPLPPKRVLVLGGTGHIGAAIARHLAGQGHAVRASGRSAEPRANLAGTLITQLTGDDHQRHNLESWSADVDLIIDAATPYPLWRHGTNPKEVVSAARRRVQGILSVAQVRGTALIQISSFTTLPPSGSLQDRLRLATVRGLHPYFEVKEVVEREVLAALRAGLQGAVINPAACFGPYDLKPVEQAFVPLVANGKLTATVRHPVNIIDVRDVAACVAALAEQDFPYVQVPVMGHNLQIDALTTLIAARAGVDPPHVRAPLLLGLASAYWAETAAAAVGRRSPWPSLPILLTAAGRRMAPSAAQTALGVTIRPLDETLGDALNWYRQLGRC